MRRRRHEAGTRATVGGLAAPIFDATGVVNATVHISAPRGRLSADRLPFVLAEMLHTAAAISGQLGATGTMLEHPSEAEVAELEASRSADDRPAR